MRKRLTGIFIVCVVFVSVMLSFNGKRENVYGGYGDRNKYTLAAEKWVEENKLNDLVLAVFEGKGDTVALFTVSDKWNELTEDKQRETVSTLFDVWFGIREPSARTLEEITQRAKSLGVVVVDINGNKLVDVGRVMPTPAPAEKKGRGADKGSKENKYTIAMEEAFRKGGLQNNLLAVFEGEQDTVALITVSDVWINATEEQKRKLYDSFFDFWMEMRNPIGGTLEESLSRVMSLDVVIVDINGNKLADLAWRRQPPNLEEAHKKDGRIRVIWVISQFKKMTQLQRELWNEKNKGVYTVYGEGTIEDVKRANFLSKIQGNYIEATVALEDGRAVVSYPESDRYNWIYNASKGSRLAFEGKLEEIQDWGFWISAYIRGE